MNKIKEIFTLNKALNQYNEIREEIDTMDSKSVLLSKTFWANVAGLGVTLSGVLPVKYGVPVLAVANILLRLVTDQPVHIFSQDK